MRTFRALQTATGLIRDLIVTLGCRASEGHCYTGHMSYVILRPFSLSNPSADHIVTDFESWAKDVPMSAARMYAPFPTAEQAQRFADVFNTRDIPHLMFSEYAPDDDAATPCVCWTAGNEYVGKPDDFQHPNEWREGAEARYERDHDI